METKEIALDAQEVFTEMSMKIDRAETWQELQEVFAGMDAICSACIIEADELVGVIQENCEDTGFKTLDEWKTLAEAILAIPKSRSYYLWSGRLNFKALANDNFEEVKELCRMEAKKFADWLYEDGRAI